MEKERIETVVNKLKNSDLTSYYIAQKTSITEATIGNYRNGKTKPKAINTKILEYFFNEIEKENSINQSIIGNSNIQTGNNSKVEYNNSTELLKTQIEEMKKMLKEKDERIKEQDIQIKEKDSQINRLLLILSNK